MLGGQDSGWACPPMGVSQVGVARPSPFPNEVSQLLGGYRALLHTVVEHLEAMVFVSPKMFPKIRHPGGLCGDPCWPQSCVCLKRERGLRT